MTYRLHIHCTCCQQGFFIERLDAPLRCTCGVVLIWGCIHTITESGFMVQPNAILSTYPALDASRVVYRVRDLVTGRWKIHNEHGNEASGPFEFSSAENAQREARYLKQWRVVKVTIRRRRRPTKAPE